MIHVDLNPLCYYLKWPDCVRPNGKLSDNGIISSYWHRTHNGFSEDRQTNTVEGAITDITKIKHSCFVLFLAVVCIQACDSYNFYRTLCFFNEEATPKLK